MTPRPHRGTYYPPGSILDGNPGSTLSGNQQPFRAKPVTPGVVYLAHQKRKRQRKLALTVGLFIATTVSVFGVGMAVTNWDSVTAAAPALGSLTASHFRVCESLVRWNCVVDGDTFWMNGQKIRVADIDTPEVFSPRCQAEYNRGIQATNRLRDLLNEGAFELASIPDRDTDKYGRKVRIVIRDGRSIGDQLVSEGLARTWSGRREPWC